MCELKALQATGIAMAVFVTVSVSRRLGSDRSVYTAVGKRCMWTLTKYVLLSSYGDIPCTYTNDKFLWNYFDLITIDRETLSWTFLTVWLKKSTLTSKMLNKKTYRCQKKSTTSCSTISNNYNRSLCRAHLTVGTRCHAPPYCFFPAAPPLHHSISLTDSSPYRSATYPPYCSYHLNQSPLYWVWPQLPTAPPLGSPPPPSLITQPFSHPAISLHSPTYYRL